MEELWKDIEGYEGHYQISNFGNVKSLQRYAKRSNGTKQFVKGRLLKKGLNRCGYEKVNLHKAGNTEVKYIARLVAIAFVENPHNKEQVNHINGVKHDNMWTNLEWVTPKENIRHAFKTGLSSVARGDDHKASKLTEEEVIEIKRLYSTGGYRYIDLAKKFDVAKITISRIITKESWKHVK